MAPNIVFEDRIRGALLGAAIGAEMGFARCVEPRRFGADSPAGMFKVPLGPVRTYRPQPGRTDLASCTALVGLGVRTYVKARGRATPEQFAGLLARDEGVAQPAFWWDSLHSTQELLKEGMHPRIGGLGICPCGLICAAMPAVGIFHFAHPHYAYLDGVELASVAQGRLGADWAGLCAAAIAAAFECGADGRTVADRVMQVAFEHNRDLFYELNGALRRAGGDEQRFLDYWHRTGGSPSPTKDNGWIACNPVQYVLPALRRYADRPRKLLALLVVPGAGWYGQAVNAVIGGAVVGALNGAKAFGAGWRRWAEPIAERWQGLAGVVRRRVRREAEIVAATRRLAEEDADGRSALKEKVRGCILAGAVGNAMGSPVEGRMYWEIDAAHPGGITTVLDPSRLEGEDDNQMAMHLVETYLSAGGRPVMARDFAETWKRRLNRDHFFPLCMGNAYDLIRRGWDGRIVGHWQVVTGSTVMCMEPVGVYHLCDPDFAAIDAAAISYMYQRGLDVTAASMMAATVAEALRPGATVDSVCDAAVAAAPTGRLKTFDRRSFRSCRHYLQACLEVADKYDDVLAARKELYDKCLLYHMIDPLELWGFALAMFRIARGDVRQAAVGGTNIGRDSDTIAGRAAMLAGTLSGAAGVPGEWVAMFPDAALRRIDRNAERLADLIVAGKLALLETRRRAVG